MVTLARVWAMAASASEQTNPVARKTVLICMGSRLLLFETTAWLWLLRRQLFPFQFGALVSAHVVFRLCVRRRAVTFASANNRRCLFNANFDVAVGAILLCVGRVITERVLMAQFFGDHRKGLREVVSRIGVMKPSAA